MEYSRKQTNTIKRLENENKQLREWTISNRSLRDYVCKHLGNENKELRVEIDTLTNRNKEVGEQVTRLENLMAQYSSKLESIFNGTQSGNIVLNESLFHLPHMLLYWYSLNIADSNRCINYTATEMGKILHKADTLSLMNNFLENDVSYL